MKNQIPKKSKRTLLSLLTLVLLGWLLLFAWVLSLWGIHDFNQARLAVSQLLQQQAVAIAEFNDEVIAEKLHAWFSQLPLDSFSNKVAQVNATIANQIDFSFTDNQDINDIALDSLNLLKQLWFLMRLTTQVMVIKLIILIAAIPLIGLAMTAGLIDGLNQRAIRTASLGRESSYVFHQLNRYFKRGLYLLLALWLALPLSITPALVFVPISILLSLMVSMTASRFKKYV